MSKNIIRLSPDQSVSMAEKWFEIADPKHFWIQHKQKLILRYFKNELSEAQNIAEIGCGNCLVINELNKQLGKPIDGIELNEYLLTKCPSSQNQLYLYNILDRNPLLKAKYDLILLLDVLEHIKNEIPFLEAISWHLKPNGKLLVNVPTISTLYSRYDEAIGHYCRYDIKPLLALLKNAGFTILRRKNWGYSFIPIIFLRKQILKLIPKNRSVQIGFKTNSLTNLILSIIGRLDFQTNWNLPGASTMVLVSKK